MNRPPFQLDPVDDEQPERKPRKGMSVHQSKRLEKDEYLSPPALVQQLGPFDTDPCSPIIRPWNTAEVHYTLLDNGLRKQWRGVVWLNPPYGTEIGKWMARMAEHNNGIALIFARTETECWHKHIWPKAKGVLFVRGRLHFHDVTGAKLPWTGGAPSALIAYGRACANRLKTSGIPGAWVTIGKRAAAH